MGMTQVGVVAMSTGGVVLYIIALEYLIVSAKNNHFNRNPNMNWVSRLSRNIQIAVCVLIVLLLIIVEILLTFTAGKAIYGFSYVALGIENMIIMQIGIGAIMVCDLVWIALLIRIPKRKSQKDLAQIRRF